MLGEQLDCDGVGWDADAAGRTNVCGSSVLIGVHGSDDMCVRESTFQEADSLCLELGARLCTVPELGLGEGQPEACGYDSAFAWRYESSPFRQDRVIYLISFSLIVMLAVRTVAGQHPVAASRHAQGTAR